MKASLERENFSRRLKQALSNAHYKPGSPTQLAREFNLRYDGEPICAHAARKWLHGDAIPTQDKLRVLAHWLGTSSEWLRFGESTEGAVGNTPDAFPRFLPDEVKLIADLQQLDEPCRNMVRDFIRMLIRTDCGRKA